MTKVKWTIKKIQETVDFYIKQGHDINTIKLIFQRENTEDDIDDDTLFEVIDERVLVHPSYSLIQKIERSKLIVDKNTSDDLYYIMDPLNKSLDTINNQRLRSLYNKPDFTAKTYVCDFEYAPYKMFSLYCDDGGIWKYNLYQPPEWQEKHFVTNGKEEIEKISECPTEYRKFFRHLVNNDDDSYFYLIDWLANALQRRNYCILTTIGNQGIGKGVLGDIMRELFGSSNFVKTECRVLTKDFNRQVKNKRLVYIDELKIKTVSEENKLKTLVNDYIEIEAKGIDAKEEKNYASIYVSSNDLDSIRLRGDDRRFSIVELTSKKLTEILSTDHIQDLFKLENIEKLAKYLFHKEVDKDKMMKVFISKRTEDVRASSLKQWEEYFLDNILPEYVGGVLTVREVSDKIENVYGSRCRPSNAALKKLQELYPSKFQIKRKQKDKQRIWCVEFLEV